MIYHISETSESQQVMYNLQLPRMISLNALLTQELQRTEFINVLKSICYIHIPGKKTFLWEISIKFTTFEENIGNGSANAERKGPGPKLGMR